jgi:hypothetical protein
VGLAAACGFRVFVPMLGLSIAAAAGHVELGPEFAWLGTPTALVCLSIATVLEIGAFYIPWLDNLLDSIATPAAVIAGTILTASVTTEISPMMKWTVAIIAGGGAAALIQTGTVLLRGGSTMTTGGSGNFIVSTIEWIGAILTTLLALILPILSAIAAVLVATYVVYRLLKPRPALDHDLKPGPIK